MKISLVADVMIDGAPFAAGDAPEISDGQARLLKAFGLAVDYIEPAVVDAPADEAAAEDASVEPQTSKKKGK